MNRNIETVLASASSLLIGGCAGMAGTGGSSGYSCQAPEGVTCNSVSGVYANAIRNDLPARARTAAPPAQLVMPSMSAGASAPLRQPAPAGITEAQELRSPPRVLRMWFKAWEDADGDLFEQGYVYVQVDAGQWQLDHVQRRARDRFTRVKPPQRTDGSSAVLESNGAAHATADPTQQPRPPQRPASPLTATD